MCVCVHVYTHIYTARSRIQLKSHFLKSESRTSIQISPFCYKSSQRSFLSFPGFKVEPLHGGTPSVEGSPGVRRVCISCTGLLLNNDYTLKYCHCRVPSPDEKIPNAPNKHCLPVQLSTQLLTLFSLYMCNAYMYVCTNAGSTLPVYRDAFSSAGLQAYMRACMHVCSINVSTYTHICMYGCMYKNIDI